MIYAAETRVTLLNLISEYFGLYDLIRRLLKVKILFSQAAKNSVKMHQFQDNDDKKIRR